MITDNQLYSLAIFLGSAAMLMIVLYHFLEVNSQDFEGGVIVGANGDALQSEKSGVGAVKPVSSTTGAGAGVVGDEKR